MTRRRWIANTWDESSAQLTGDNAVHLARVLRAEIGTEYDIVAGGRLWRAEVNSVSEHEVGFSLLAEMDAEPALPVTLVMSVFKFDRMEWAIEKATELGVAHIIPVIARRTEKHLALAAAKRLDRWRRIVIEASQQSRRSSAPEISEVMPLNGALLINRSANPGANILLAEHEQSRTIKNVIEEICSNTEKIPHLRIAVGPEGGWAPEEVALFHAAGWKAVTLGPRILRAETAAIAALSVVAALLE